jgi:Cof subfamily protein (haloacid dehalogenase superfamily)
MIFSLVLLQMKLVFVASFSSRAIGGHKIWMLSDLLQGPIRTHHCLSAKKEDSVDDEDDDYFISKSLEEVKRRVTGLDPFAPVNRPSKAEVYSDTDLARLWSLHQTLSPDMAKAKSTAPTAEEQIPSLHELVLQALADAPNQVDVNGGSGGESSLVGYSQAQQFVGSISHEILARLPRIRAIASDVDGTLLSSSSSSDYGTLHPTTLAAVQEAIQAAADPRHTLGYFFPATGKSRAGALASLGPELGALLSQGAAGVFLQGLYCVDPTGAVVFERKLNTSVVHAAVDMAVQHNLSLFAYNGDAIYALTHSNPQHILDFHYKFGEPLPVVMEPKQMASYKDGWHKLVFMDNDTAKIAAAYRPLLDTLATKHRCATTQAIPTMLELLPEGCSKAFGVQKLCERLGIDPSTELLAIGDAENDLEMLEMAACGVAVANAVPMTKKVADIVLNETSGEGGAGIAIQLFGLGKIL